MSWSEILGFVAGALSVWLYVRQSVWAWPTGIANSVFWLILFAGSRLYLDASLQIVYIGLGIVGWVWWVRPRREQRELPVARTLVSQAVALGVIGAVATAGLWWLMVRVDDAAPLPDAATTVVSLIAQYMLTRKLLANWWLWISVDVAYVALYVAKHLYLTAALQPLFIALCVAGLRSWRVSMRTAETPVVAAVAA
jgi:nicotinamide mononucleotide transporter